MPTLDSDSDAKGSSGAKEEGAPGAKEVAISGEGYNQTYIILKHDEIEQCATDNTTTNTTISLYRIPIFAFFKSFWKGPPFDC